MDPGPQFYVLLFVICSVLIAILVWFYKGLFGGEEYWMSDNVHLVVKYDKNGKGGLDPRTFKPYEPDIGYIKVNREKSIGFELVKEPKEATVFHDYYEAETYKRKCMSGDRVGNEGSGTTSIVARASIREIN